MSFDPKTPEIKKMCESLIGCKINIGFTITLKSGENLSGGINNCNIVGDCMEDIIYPFIKRYLSIPQFVLGAAFGWAVPMVFAAETKNLPILAWLLFGTVVIWAVIYDTFYAMIDRNDDIKVGVKSTAILFGDADLFIIAGLQSIMLVMLIFIGFFIKLSIWFFSSIFIASIFMIYHLWLARNREPHGCYAAFKNNHIIGLVIFFGFLIHYTFNPG